MKISLAVRAKAIFDCLYFGFVPSVVYEKDCHYKGISYKDHLLMNLRYIPAWINTETAYSANEEDVRFVLNTNTYIRKLI